jgi:hypothetical protein
MGRYSFDSVLILTCDDLFLKHIRENFFQMKTHLKDPSQFVFWKMSIQFSVYVYG